MKRGLLLMIVGLIATVAFSQKRETRQVSGFTGINASGVFNITVLKGDTESLTIEADEGIMQYIHSEVRNGILHLNFDNRNRLKNIKALKTSIVMKNLENVIISGACKLTTVDQFSPDKLNTYCSGASTMTINAITGQLSIESSGACKIMINASVTGDTNLNLSGASKIRGELTSNHVKLNSSGVSSIEITGTANNIIIDVSGASKIIAEDFKVKTATVRSAGTGNVTVNASDSLNVNASGPSTVKYKGAPVVEVNVSKMATVRSI